MYTPQTLKKVDIFISSPSDVKAEREAIKRVIELLNRMLYIPMGILLYPLTYEELVPPAMGKPAQIIVDRYMQEPDKCYLLICVLWTRMGTPFIHPTTGERYQSGTEYEFIKAYKANETQNMPQILLYRRVSDGVKKVSDEEQAKQVAEFFDKVIGDKAIFKGLFQHYRSLREFEKSIQIHIADILRNHPPKQTIETITRPKMIEENRRVDVALPEAAAVGKPTELWLQLCAVDSSGFRDQLGAERTSTFELSQEDIIEHPLGIAFPLDMQTQEPESVVLRVELVAPDFEVSASQLTLNVTYRKDTSRLVFSLVPKVSNPNSILHIYLKQMMPEKFDVVIETLVLYTKILPEINTPSKWLFLQRPIAAITSLLNFSHATDFVSSNEMMFTNNHPEETSVSYAYGIYSDGIIKMLKAALDNEYWDIQRAAIELGKIRTGHAIILLIATLNDKHWRVRCAAAAALGSIGNRLAVGPLTATLRDNYWLVRQWAAYSLEKIGTPEALEAVRQYRETFPNTPKD